MNKKFAQFFTDYGLTVDKNSAYGIVKGYETNAAVISFGFDNNKYPVRIHISFYATDDQKRAIESAIRSLALKFFNMQFTQYGLSVGLSGMTNKSIITRLPDVLDKIFAILAENGALGSSCCPVCGKPLDPASLKPCNVDGFKITIDGDCVNTLNSAINAENQEFDNAPNNYLKGFLGALIGGLAGAALTVIMYLVGYVSSICAIVAIVLGAFLYEKFHGKPNKMMIVIVAATTLVCMIASIFGTYIAIAGNAAKDAGLHMNAFEAFRYVMGDDEISRGFYTDLALVVLYSAVGIGVEIYILMKKIKRKTTIQF